jgi:DNA adenine methylase
LSDTNEDLINTYRVVREDPGAVIARLKKLEVSEAVYYRVRASQPSDRAARAARFLYLNRTAFGGIYRLNLRGEFNVPYGGGERTPAILWETSVLTDASAALKSAKLHSGDFEEALTHARRGDVVYCDPTYSVAHDHNGFVRYNEHNFSWADQLRLAEVATRAVARGASVILSNAYNRSIRELYPNARVQTVERRSAVSPNPKKRRVVKEYLILV